jgi:hypothetical protein
MMAPYRESIDRLEYRANCPFETAEAMRTLHQDLGLAIDVSSEVARH